ncbi:hypothetical protein CapIbe_016746 [Capra ibex]
MPPFGGTLALCGSVTHSSFTRKGSLGEPWLFCSSVFTKARPHLSSKRSVQVLHFLVFCFYGNEMLEKTRESVLSLNSG